jgi:hypothetical protein
VSIMKWSIGATNGLFKEMKSNIYTDFQRAGSAPNDSTSAYRLVSWNTRTNMLFLEPRLNPGSLKAGRRLRLFLIKLENTFINGSIGRLMTAKVTVA